MISREKINLLNPVKPLGDVVEFLDNLRIPIKESERNPGEYPYYGANGQQGTIDKFIFDEPLLLLAEDGGFFFDLNKPIAYKVNGKCWVNNHAHVLRPKSDLDIDFLFYQLQFYDLSPFVNGTTRGKLTRGAADQIPIYIPKKEKQRKISLLLNKTSSIIKKREKTIKLADEFLRSTFLEMFGHPETNPHNYRIVRIRDIVQKVTYGTSKPAQENGKYKYLRMNNITFDGFMDFSRMKYIDMNEDEKIKYMVTKGDLIFNRTNSKELVGKTAVFKEDEDMVIAGYLIRVRTNDFANTDFLNAYLNSSYCKSLLRNMCKSIIGMANINAQEFQDIKIYLPPIELQNKYSKIGNKIYILKKKYLLSKIEMVNQFNSLMQRAFKGEL